MATIGARMCRTVGHRMPTVYVQSDFCLPFLEKMTVMMRRRNFTLLLALMPWLAAPLAIRAADTETLPHPEVARIEPKELKRLIDDKAPVVIVDTRDSLSYDTGHVPGAVNIQYDPTGDPASREMMLVALPMDKLVVLYCP